MKKKLLFSLLFTTLLVGCGSKVEPQVEKPQEDEPKVQEHVCGHKCSECGKCTDLTCNNNVCKEKCQGHQPEVKEYTITFKDDEGKLLENKKYKEGEMPSYSYDKQDTVEYDYTFEGWSKTLGGEATPLESATKDITYYAVISKERLQFDIIFKDENDNSLYTLKCAKGVIPSFTYNVDSRDTNMYDYTFEGWSKTLGGEVNILEPATQDMTYYLIVSRTIKQYTITFEENGGSSIDDITVDYNTVVSEPSTKPKLDKYVFTGWSYDQEGKESVTWPITLKSNITLYAQYNEKVDIVGIIKKALKFEELDPYSYIPETMQAKANITAQQANYNFENDTKVKNIKYGGHGEQWHMALENMAESERFYNVLTSSEAIINSSVILFNNFFDNNPSATSGTVNGSEDSKGFNAYVNCTVTTLNYSLALQTGWTIPLLGEIKPQIDVSYNVITFERVVRIQLTSENAIAYHISSDGYTFGLKYGTSAVSRKAYCQMNKDDKGNVQGHIYEFIQAVGKDLVPSCCDFYISDDYTSCVGNKANGIPGFKGFINELYKTSEGKLLGYEVQEELSIAGIDLPVKYDTLWFNLSDVTGIDSIKAIRNENPIIESNKNPHDIYINGSEKILETARNKVAVVISTSRKFDIELRKQYFYEDVDGELVTHEVDIPMMFVQAKNYETYSDNMKDLNKITSSITLSSTYKDKIEADYAALIDVFKTNKELVTGDTINTFIGSAVTLD